MLGFLRWYSLILCWVGIVVNIWLFWQNYRSHKELVAIRKYYEQKVKEIENDNRENERPSGSG